MKKLLLSSVLFTLTAGSAFALNGKGVMDKVYKVQKQFKNEQFETEMTVKKDGSKRVSQFETCVSRAGSKNNTLIGFYKPANMKGTGMLIKKKGGNEDTRIYLPSLRAIRKIEGEDRHKSFMGSDFTNADVIGRELNDDTHTLTATTDKYYTVVSKPKKKDNYSKFEYKIAKSVMIPTSVKFYNKSGKLSKTLKNKKLGKVEGKYTVTFSIMENHITGGSTEIKKYNFDVKSKIKTNAFSIPVLKTGARCK